MSEGNTEIGLKTRAGAWRSFITIPTANFILSMFAISLSAGTFYSNVLKKVDDLRLVVDGTVQLSGTRESLNATPTSLRMTLINAGNREVAITSVSLVVDQLDQSGLPKASCLNNTVPFETEPILLKEGEISIQQMRVPGDFFTYKPCKPVGPKETLTVRASATFAVVTPHGAFYVASAPLNTVSVGPSSFSTNFLIHIGLNEAQTLYSHTEIRWW
jgi:hypothetical protein